MAGSASDYLENKILDHILGNTAYTAPATIYFALYTVAPSDSGGGTEVTGGSYARKAVTNNTTNFPNASGGSKSVPGAAFDFVTATANWGTVVAFSMMDASTAGNFLYWADLATNKAVNDGDIARFEASSITVTQS